MHQIKSWRYFVNPNYSFGKTPRLIFQKLFLFNTLVKKQNLMESLPTESEINLPESKGLSNCEKEMNFCRNIKGAGWIL
jgi:hypothetical protein